MIAIKFSPIYEDRVSIFLKNTNLKDLGVTWYFKEEPYSLDKKYCFWIIDYKNSRHVNTILSSLREMKEIMGIDDLEFSYCYNEKEYYSQYCDGGLIPWFKV